MATRQDLAKSQLSYIRLNNHYNLVQGALFIRKPQRSIRFLDGSKQSTLNYQTMNGATMTLTSPSGGKKNLCNGYKIISSEGINRLADFVA